jgi:RNA polymerase sigma-70 factor (ECF subfamily)
MKEAMQAAAGEMVLENIPEELARTTEPGSARQVEFLSSLGGRTGPVRAFDKLFELHQQRVLRTAYRLLGRVEDAQDAAQEVFLRLLKNMHRIEGDAQAWLYRVTVNVCNDQYRRRPMVMELDAELRDSAPDPERVLALEERKRLLMEGLQTLPERERTAVVLRDIEGLSTREVAAILSVEEVTVRSHISTARVKLAKYVRTRK